MEATWNDTIAKVMAKRAADPDEVVDFALPSRAQPIEVRSVPSSGSGTACFVACYDHSKIKHSTKQVSFRRTDGTGKSYQ